MKSLKASGSVLASSDYQLDVLRGISQNQLTPFQQKMEEVNLFPLKPSVISILQVNLGKMCNQVCRHCHVDAGPDRKEIMTKEVMRELLRILEQNPQLDTVDMTGGAPELNPNFRWFTEEVSRLHRKVIVRCNLTIILSNKRFNDLPEFYRSHNVEVVSSLPFFTKDRTDRQRGDGVFYQSIEALQRLNTAGYGMEDSSLVLNLVYNPAGAFLPPDQGSLEKEYRENLLRDHGIRFNNLFAITNMPISRYLDYLLQSGNYEKYMQKLVSAFNPAAAQRVMCRNTISVSYDGYLYDCDFNQMLDMKLADGLNHVSNFNLKQLAERDILICQHCYGCTAGSGSSCGGTVT